MSRVHASFEAEGRGADDFDEDRAWMFGEPDPRPTVAEFLERAVALGLDVAIATDPLTAAFFRDGLDRVRRTGRPPHLARDRRE